MGFWQGAREAIDKEVNPARLIANDIGNPESLVYFVGTARG